MARTASEYSPGGSLPAGKLKRPSLSLTTVVVMEEPALVALTSTPSMDGSAAEPTWPVKAGVCAETIETCVAKARLAAKLAVRTNRRDIAFSPQAMIFVGLILALLPAL